MNFCWSAPPKIVFSSSTLTPLFPSPLSCKKNRGRPSFALINRKKIQSKRIPVCPAVGLTEEEGLCDQEPQDHSSLLLLPPQPTPPQLPLLSEQKQEQEHQQEHQLLLQENLRRLQYFPFAKGSNNLITCSSNSGKSHFLSQIVKHRQKFFQLHEQIHRVVYVNGNKADHSFEHPWVKETENKSFPLEVISLSLEDFTDYGSILQKGDILVVDDLFEITDSINFILKYGSHHFGLYTFFVTQSCLSSRLYRLLASVHNLILLFGNSATSRLAQHLTQVYFLSTDTKSYLKSLFSVAETQHDIICLKLNTVASYPPHRHILALSRLQGLYQDEPPYCFAYPELGREEDLLRSGQLLPGQINADMSAQLPKLDGNFLVDEAYILLPASRVQTGSSSSISDTTANPDASGHGENGQGRIRGDKKKSTQLCMEEKIKHWNNMALFLESEIESTFPLRRWGVAKNLMREILRCSDLCISSDYRSIFLQHKPKLQFSVIDFLSAATRKAGPGENDERLVLFRPLVQVLLRHNVPRAFIQNKLLLPNERTTSFFRPEQQKRRHSRKDFHRWEK